MTPTPGPRRRPFLPRRGPAAAAGLVASALALTGCVSHEAPAAPKAPAATSAPSAPPASAPPTTATVVTGTAPPPAAGATTTAAPPVITVPPARSTAPSAVDANAIHSAADLAAAFGCPSAPAPITLAPSVLPGIGVSAPPAIVCSSALVGGEALFLYYAATPLDRAAAITAAIKQAKYVHAGVNWVAGGTIDKTMGSVGGEVYK